MFWCDLTAAESCILKNSDDLHQIYIREESCFRTGRTVTEEQMSWRSSLERLPNYLVSCLRVPATINPHSLFVWSVNNSWPLTKSHWGEMACDSSPLLPSFTLVFWDWILKRELYPASSDRVALGTHVVLFAPSQRKWFVLWGWQLVFVLWSEPTMRESGAKPMTMMDEVKQSRPPLLSCFPHSCLPWQLAAAAHCRREQHHQGHSRLRTLCFYLCY